MNRATNRMLRPAAAVAAVATLVALLAGCSLQLPGQPVPSPTITLPPDTIEIESNLVYREVDGAELALDACLPKDPSSARPAMLLLHGGGFEAGDRSAMRGLCEHLAEQGIAGVAIDYRLLPDDIYPAQLDDARAALEWLRAPEQIESLRIDPTRIGALGSSAGAIIALSLGVGLGADAPDVHAVVSLSGAADMTAAARDLGDPGEDEIRTVLAYLGCTEIERCPISEQASPIVGVGPGDAAMLLVNGTAEIVPGQQAERMRDALEQAGVPAQLLLVDGSGHGVELLTGEVDAAITTFLGERL